VEVVDSSGKGKGRATAVYQVPREFFCFFDCLEYTFNHLLGTADNDEEEDEKVKVCSLADRAICCYNLSVGLLVAQGIRRSRRTSMLVLISL
jgi:hypothetical protein